MGETSLYLTWTRPLFTYLDLEDFAAAFDTGGAISVGIAVIAWWKALTININFVIIFEVFIVEENILNALVQVWLHAFL